VHDAPLVAAPAAQYTHGCPENGPVTVLRATAEPWISTSPIARERMREVGVFSIVRFMRRSRRPCRNTTGPETSARLA
jgi:hypothetical protein